MVKALESYPWSSYPIYVGAERAPDWLYFQEVYQQLPAKRRLREKYREFVEMGVDEEIADFYGKGNQKPYLGGDGFREWVFQQRLTEDGEVSRACLQCFRPDIDEVIESVVMSFGVELSSITENQRGRREENIPHWVVMYLAQEVCGLTLCNIADRLGLKRTGSIPTTIAKLKSRMESDRGLLCRVRRIKREYDA